MVLKHISDSQLHIIHDRALVYWISSFKRFVFSFVNYCNKSYKSAKTCLEVINYD